LHGGNGVFAERRDGVYLERYELVDEGFGGCVRYRLAGSWDCV
jgi:hypothetical protein